MESGRHHCWPPGMDADFRGYLLARRRAATTADSYVRNVGYFAAWCAVREVCIAEATHEAVTAYINELLASRLHQNTVAHRLTCIRVFFKFCRKQGWRADDPCEDQAVKWIDIDPRQPFTEGELDAMLRGCRNERDRAMVRVGYRLGLRVHEVVGLREHHFDERRMLVYVHGKGDRVEPLPLAPDTLEMVRPFFGAREGVLWWTRKGKGSQPLSVKRAQRMLEQVARRAGVSHCHWHRLRTTFANDCFDAGMALEDVQDVMRHKQVSTTIRYGKHTIHKRAHESLRALQLELRF